MNKISLNQRVRISQMKYSKGIWKNLLAEGAEINWQKLVSHYLGVGSKRKRRIS